MKTRTLATAMLAGVFCLTGCDNKDSVISLSAMNPVADSIPRHWIEIPALPIIQRGVSELVPHLSDQSHVNLMGQICSLARGELEQGQVNEALKHSQIDAGSIPKQFSRLVNGEKSTQQTACAAYLASNVPPQLDSSELVQPAASAASVSSAEDSSRLVKEEGQTGAKSNAAVESNTTSTEHVEQTVLQVDSASLQQALPIKLAIARANADVFALIAVELQRRPGLSIAEYQVAAGQLFAQLAPTYLERIKALTLASGVEYHLLRIDSGLLAFSSSDGGLFESSAQGLSMLQNGVLWYGQGKLLGQDYPLLVAYFDPSISQLLVPSAQLSH